MTHDPDRDDAEALWRFEELPGIECLRTTLHRYAFARHAHPTYVVAVGDGAGYALSCEGSQHRVPPGSILVLHPEEAHDGYSVDSRPIDYRGFYPSVERLACAADGSPGRAPQFPRRVIHDPPLAARLRRAHDALAREGVSLRAESWLIDALGTLVRRHAEGPPRARRADGERGAVRRAKDHLLSRLAEPVTLRELADVARLSPFHLLRVFRAELGLPPHAFLVRARLERAKELLASGFPAARAALEAGFADQSHFCRHFRRTFGTTPGRFRVRKNVQDPIDPARRGCRP